MRLSLHRTRPFSARQHGSGNPQNSYFRPLISVRGLHIERLAKPPVARAKLPPTALSGTQVPRRCYPHSMKKCLPAIFFALLLPIAACKSSHAAHIALAQEPPPTPPRRPPPAPASTTICSISPGRRSFATPIPAPPSAPRMQPSSSTAYGLKTTTAPIPKAAPAPPAPPTPPNTKTSIPTKACSSTSGKLTASAPASAADAFFQTARSAVRSINIPPALPPSPRKHPAARSNPQPLHHQQPASPAESIVVSCGHNFLTAIEVCLDKRLHPIACTAVRSCRANTVRIPPP